MWLLSRSQALQIRRFCPYAKNTSFIFTGNAPPPSIPDCFGQSFGKILSSATPVIPLTEADVFLSCGGQSSENEEILK